MRLLALVSVVLCSPVTRTTGGSSSGISDAAGVVTVNAGEDLQALAQAHPERTTFLLQPGVYRLQEVTPKDGQSFVGTGSGQVVLSGAERLTSANVSRDCGTGLFVARNQTARGSFHGPCIANRPRCNYTQDLFLDELPLTHVASRGAVGPGRWFFDLNASTLWLADDPSGRTLELGVA